MELSASNLTRLTVPSVVILLAVSCIGDVSACGKGGKGGEPCPQDNEVDWRACIEGKLETKISFDFVDTPLDDVIAFFSCIMPISFIVDTKDGIGQKPVTLRANAMKLKVALKWICRLTETSHVLEDGAFFISTERRLKEGGFRLAKPLPPALKKKLQRKVSFDFVDTPVADIARFLGQLTGISFQLDPKASPKGTTVTLKVNDLPLKRALGWMMRIHGLGYRPEGENGISIYQR